MTVQQWLSHTYSLIHIPLSNHRLLRFFFTIFRAHSHHTLEQNPRSTLANTLHTHTGRPFSATTTLDSVHCRRNEQHFLFLCANRRIIIRSKRVFFLFGWISHCTGSVLSLYTVSVCVSAINFRMRVFAACRVPSFTTWKEFMEKKRKKLINGRSYLHVQAKTHRKTHISHTLHAQIVAEKIGICTESQNNWRLR